jgi:predicted aminopeptidase
VVAAPELSLKLSTWCFPVVGCVGYRGYYDQTEATAFADALKPLGLEVSVYGVPAYSTLGLLPGDAFADPLLNTFIDLPEGELARLIFHELAHQVAFVPDDMVFNESFATAVERLGGARWMAAHASPSARQLDAQVIARRQDFRDLTERYRARLDALYRGTALDEPARLTAKAELMAQLRAEHRQLKQARWDGYGGYDAWFAGANNASLGVLAAYHARVPEFEALFERGGRDFDRFYAEVRRLARLPAGQRLAGLR